MVKWFEDLFSIVNALGVCIFPADKLALGPTDYAEMFSAFLEEEIGPEELTMIGERIFNMQRLFNMREGVTRKDDSWPDRFLRSLLWRGLREERFSREKRWRMCSMNITIRGVGID